MTNIKQIIMGFLLILFPLGNLNAAELLSFSDGEEYREISSKIQKALSKKGSNDLSSEDQYYIALGYYAGILLQKNEEKSFSFFQECANANNTKCLENIAVFYSNGIVVKEDPDAAFQYMRKSAELGSEQAMVNLSLFYNTGYGVKRNSRDAEELLRKAAKSGSKDARYYLAAILVNRDKSDEYVEARKILAQLVNEGDVKSMNLLGEVLSSGTTEKRDVQRASELFLSAANNGDVDAVHNLAKLLLSENIACDSCPSVADLLLVGAAYGNSEAKYLLSGLKDISITDHDFVKYHLMNASAQSGYNPSRVNLAIRIFTGESRIFSVLDGLEHLRAASVDGYAPADYNLALWYLNEQVEDEFQDLAIYYLHRAKIRGYKAAEKKLNEIKSVQ